MSRLSAFALLCALLLAVVASLIVTTSKPRSSSAATTVLTSRPWPVPLPDWFWVWARWYLHRSEFAGEPFRAAGTRPDDAPRRIPAWAWLRLRVLLGQVDVQTAPANAQSRA